MPEKRGRKRKAVQPAPPVVAKVGPEAEIPEPPGHLEGLEVEAWRAACEALASRSLLESADLALVEQFAVTYAMARRVRDLLKNEPLTTQCKMSGRTYVNPLIAIQSDHGAKIRALLVELSLTPRSRRMPGGAGGEPDAFDAFIATPGATLKKKA